MKLLTLNTHSLAEKDSERSAVETVGLICREKPDLIALQEVSQRTDSPIVPTEEVSARFRVCDSSVPIREDLYGLLLDRLLQEADMDYRWTWLPVKRGYGQYDEGLAVFCRRPLTDIHTICVSSELPYENWRRRMLLGILPQGSDRWFYSVHYGWWEDKEEPFALQWGRTLAALQGKRVCLLGDFNNPAHRRGEGYDLVSATGFFDSFALAKERRGDATVVGEIDGWRHDGGEPSRRIDQILWSDPVSVSSYRTVFDGTDGEVVSDHFGILITAKERWENQ